MSKRIPGQTVRYTSWGVEKTGVITRIGGSGIVFLSNGTFVFPESVIDDDAESAAMDDINVMETDA